AIGAMGDAILGPGDVRTAVEIMEGDVLCFIDRLAFARLHQVARDLRLAIDGDLSSDERGKVDAMAVTIKGDVRAVMDNPFGVEPLADLGALHEVDRALFKHAGTDAAEHVVRAL